MPATETENDMDDPNMHAYGNHYADDSDQPLPLPPEAHPLRKLGQRLTELLDEDHCTSKSHPMEISLFISASPLEASVGRR